MFVLRRFGDVDLPPGNPQSDMGSFDVVDTTVRVSGGFVLDAYGFGNAPAAATRFVHRASLRETTAETLETAYRSLLGQTGRVQKLHRYWLESGFSEWAYARLVSVRAVSNLIWPEQIDGITATFSMLTPQWNGRRHGYTWKFDEGEKFDTGLEFDNAESDQFEFTSSPGECTVENSGNRSAVDVQILVRAEGGAITSLDIAGPNGVSLGYDGTIDAGATLTIDGGNLSVLNGSADAYADFTMSSLNEYWIELSVGDNDFTFTWTGTATAVIVTFRFYDGWA